MKDKNNLNLKNINYSYFKDFLDSKNNNLLLRNEFVESYLCTSKFKKSSFSESISKYVFAYDEQRFLDFEEYKKIEKTTIEDLSPLEKFTDYIRLHEDKISPLKFLVIELFSTFLTLKTFEIKEFYHYDGNHGWRISLELKNEQIFHYNTLDLVHLKKEHYKDVKLGFKGFGATGTKESIFYGLPLFYMVEDFEREKHIDLPTTISYGDLLRAQRDGLSKKDIISKHLKNAKKLENIVNVNKFSLTESYTLIKAATEFDERTFVNFVKWFREKGRYTLNTIECFLFVSSFWIVLENMKIWLKNTKQLNEQTFTMLQETMLECVEIDEGN